MSENNHGGFFHNAGGIALALFAVFLFWPLLLPLNGLGQNYTAVTAWNWILEVAWLSAVIWFAVWISRRKKK